MDKRCLVFLREVGRKTDIDSYCGRKAGFLVITGCLYEFNVFGRDLTVVAE